MECHLRPTPSPAQRAASLPNDARTRLRPQRRHQKDPRASKNSILISSTGDKSVTFFRRIQLPARSPAIVPSGAAEALPGEYMSSAGYEMPLTPGRGFPHSSGSGGEPTPACSGPLQKSGPPRSYRRLRPGCTGSCRLPTAALSGARGAAGAGHAGQCGSGPGLDRKVSGARGSTQGSGRSDLQ